MTELLSRAWRLLRPTPRRDHRAAPIEELIRELEAEADRLRQTKASLGAEGIWKP